jgi:pilus assembly protein CpaB
MDRNRILMLFGGALVCAVLLTWFLYAKTVAPHELPRKTIMAADRDLVLGSTIKKTDVKSVGVLEKDLPNGAIFSADQVVGRVVLLPISKNEPLTAMRVSSLNGADAITSSIPAGYRAVSVPINDVSGVSGLVQPGSKVDVLFTRPGNMAEAITSTILQNVKVLAVGRSLFPNQVLDPKASKMPVAALLVTPEQAQKLELAKNEGKISLSLRNPLDVKDDLDGTPVTTEVLDPDGEARSNRRRRNNRNIEDPSVMAALKAPPPPKPMKAAPPLPRAVVDVFRGDKHVQEVFHD